MKQEHSRRQRIVWILLLKVKVLSLSVSYQRSPSIGACVSILQTLIQGRGGKILTLQQFPSGSFSISTMVGYQLKRLHLITSFDSNDQMWTAREEKMWFCSTSPVSAVQIKIKTKGACQKKIRDFWEFFPYGGGRVSPNPKTFVIWPSNFWHAKIILRC